MQIIDKQIIVPSRSTVVEVYPIGDVHIGKINCAEKHLISMVKEIADNPHAYWVGGGDLMDCIKPSDAKRFDMSVIPSWMLEGGEEKIRERLSDIVSQQVNRTAEIFAPIAHKCLGLIEGNHEEAMRKHYNDNVQEWLCRKLDTINLTDEALIRLRFKRKGSSSGATVKMYIQHGFGGGRTAGAEPNKLEKLRAEWEDADMVFRGHSHSFCIMPPKPVLCIPNSGALPEECDQRYRLAANWGAWLFSHSVGISTYESRAAYPARPLVTCKAQIEPFHAIYNKRKEIRVPRIGVQSVTL